MSLRPTLIPLQCAKFPSVCFSALLAWLPGPIVDGPPSLGVARVTPWRSQALVASNIGTTVYGHHLQDRPNM